ncbi:piggyBac transposable element-derived protein 4-like [Vespula squamosa]|uniref:PiggyBac transposable element-derived protein 4-like n=1 Tax=Vespula squamosa TaxID=30214 RepID=A0ABD2BDV1_VESSQ
MNSLKSVVLSNAAGQYVSSFEERTLSCSRIFSLDEIMLEKININSEEDDSSDSDIIQLTGKRRNLIYSESDENDVKGNILVKDSISSSEEWEDVTELEVPSTINFDKHHQISGPQIPNNVKRSMDYFTLYFTNELWHNVVGRFLQILWMIHLKKPARSDSTIRTHIQKASHYLEYIDSNYLKYRNLDKISYQIRQFMLMNLWLNLKAEYHLLRTIRISQSNGVYAYTK